ncbi:MAG: glucosaminidase domain-containing protein [Saprospiraceae bacterium]|nr:glucosaminidase domain-containing protein [Saprospiraceae bacterium]
MNKTIIITTLLSVMMTGTLSANKKLTELYLLQFKDVAIHEMRTTGIPASIKLAQGLLESDCGRSDLASKANNHFGIKCGKEWTGEIFYKFDDDTDEQGALVESCFRAFPEAVASYKAHSDFLTNPAKKARYGFLFDYQTTDYVSWANGLKFAGYATDPKYPEKLIKIIESYQLYKYDEPVFIPRENKAEVVSSPQVVKEPVKNDVVLDKNKESSKIKKSSDKASGPSKIFSYSIGKNNDIKMVKAKGGETLEGVAKSTGTDVYDLLEYNEGYQSKDDRIPTGSLIYLQKKKRSYGDKKDMHKVSEGETMFSIAQKYGIRLESLYAKNNMEPGTEPLKGEKISLNRHLPKKETPKNRVVSNENPFINMGELK